jgi:hypothetical protein
VESIDDALERAWDKREEWEQMGLNASRDIHRKHPADSVNFFNQKLEELISRPADLPGLN